MAVAYNFKKIANERQLFRKYQSTLISLVPLATADCPGDRIAKSRAETRAASVLPNVAIDRTRSRRM